MDSSADCDETRILLIGGSGYLGSRFAYEINKRGWMLDGCDRLPPLPGLQFNNFFQMDYADLTVEILSKYSAVLWFAGHSTVGKCIDDPAGSVHNNLTELLFFAAKLNELDIPLIYASTASIYSSEQNEFTLVADERRANIYDSGKLSFDITLNALGYRAIGLRLATVAGWAPHIRWETIFNSMNHRAYNDGRVYITNPSNFRSILFTDELADYVLRLLVNVQKKDSIKTPTQIPLSCWSGTIGALGAEIAAFWGVPLEFGPDSGTYSFVLPDSPLRSYLNDSHIFYRSIADRCRDLARSMNWRLPNNVKD